jgi:DNA-binding XRE family transcriptional regulator
LTQEQLADKLMVLRQAITKWETDKGIENNVDKP